MAPCAGCKARAHGAPGGGGAGRPPVPGRSPVVGGDPYPSFPLFSPQQNHQDAEQTSISHAALVFFVCRSSYFIAAKKMCTDMSCSTANNHFSFLDADRIKGILGPLTPIM